MSSEVFARESEQKDKPARFAPLIRPQVAERALSPADGDGSAAFRQDSSRAREQFCCPESRSHHPVTRVWCLHCYFSRKDCLRAVGRLPAHQSALGSTRRAHLAAHNCKPVLSRWTASRPRLFCDRLAALAHSLLHSRIVTHLFKLLLSVLKSFKVLPRKGYVSSSVTYAFVSL